MNYQQRLSEIMKRHWVALLAAALVGLIYIGPYLFFAHQLGSDYQGVALNGAPDEQGYLTIINSLAQGKPMGDPYIFEYRNLGNNMDYYAIERSLAVTANTFHVSVPDLMVAFKFIAPAVLFLIIYGFAFELMGVSGGALFTSLLVLLGGEVAQAGPASIHALFSGAIASPDFLTYARPVNPAESSILLFAVLWLILKLYKGERRFGSVFTAGAVGLAVGAMSYIYFYFWAFPLILCGVVLLYELAARNTQVVKRFFVALVASVISAAPFLSNIVFLFLAPPANGNFGAPLQKAFTRTHEFIPEKTVLLPLIVFAVMLMWRGFF